MQPETTSQKMMKAPRWVVWRYGEAKANGKRPKISHSVRTGRACDHIAAMKPLGDAGFEMAREWSRRSSKHDDAEFAAKWAEDWKHSNYRAEFSMAQANGWQNPGWLQDVAPVQHGLAKFDPRDGQVCSPNPNRFKLLTGDDLDRRGPIEWRIKGIAPKKGLFAIGGPSRSGKSNLAFSMAASLATGTDFFGHKTEACTVVYAGLEGVAGIPGRYKAMRQHMQNDLSNFRVILQSIALNSEQDITDLAAVCPKGSVVIIDTFSRATPGMDENRTKEMSAIIASTAKLSDLIDGLVVLVHHTGKDESKGLRGANDLTGALDGCIIVHRDGDSAIYFRKITRRLSRL